MMMSSPSTNISLDPPERDLAAVLLQTRLLEPRLSRVGRNPIMGQLAYCQIIHLAEPFSKPRKEQAIQQGSLWRLRLQMLHLHALHHMPIFDQRRTWLHNRKWANIHWEELLTLCWVVAVAIFCRTRLQKVVGETIEILQNWPKRSMGGITLIIERISMGWSLGVLLNCLC